jgi:hypothetical protein
MTIKEMHYDFKKKLNKIDSQQYRNLLVPEIDITLNEAAEIFIKQRVKTGIEMDQRSVDDIRTLFVEQDLTVEEDSTVILPDDYWHYLSSKAALAKEDCTVTDGKIFIRQHDDEFERSPFDRSSFEWRTVNAVFYENRLKFFVNDFLITSFSLSYLRRMLYMHNAEDFKAGEYTLPGHAAALTGTQECELPEHTHREIVDIAVLIATGEIEAPNSYQLRQAKVNMNQ